MTPEVAGYEFVLACIGLLCVQAILLLLMVASGSGNRTRQRRRRKQ
jgi:hypothetical protein